MTAQATSPFTQPSAAAMLGLGSPLINVYDVTALAAVGPTTITLAVPSPGGTKFQLRIKTSAVNAATTILRGNVTATDGTNPVVVQPARAAASAAGGNFDEIFEFLTDIQVTSVSFPVTLGGGTTTATINSELYGNP
jgi:hypothetical protein